MSGNARFHDKLHRANHHTLSTSGLLDSAYDPIASPDFPFRGDFILSGGLSALGGLTANNLNIRSEITIDGNSTTQNQTIVGKLKLSLPSYGGTVIYAQNSTPNPLDYSLTLNYENGVFVSHGLIVNGTLSANFPESGGTIPTANDISNAYVTLKTNSATNWSYQGADLKALSSNWQSTYTTVTANSATNWSYQGADLKALSSNWQSTYTTVTANSGNWLSKTSIVSAASASFNNLSAGYLLLKSYAQTRVIASNPSGLVPIDLSLGTVFTLDLTNSVSTGFSIVNVPVGVNSFNLLLTQDGTGSKTVNFNFISKTLRWSGSAPTMTSTANATDIYSFMTVDGNTWYGSVIGQNFA
jgi:hypothetical protein